jgi:transketolase-like protein
MRNVFCSTLVRFAAHPDFVFLTGDLGFQALEPLREQMGGRFIYAGVAEQNMVSVAAGLGKSGLRPSVYSIAPFLYARVFEQIRNDVCLHGIPVVLVGNGGNHRLRLVDSVKHAASNPRRACSLPRSPLSANGCARYRQRWGPPACFRPAALVITQKTPPATEAQLIELRKTLPSFGSRRLIREFDLPNSHRALERIWREHGLLKKRRRKYQRKDLAHIKARWALFQQISADTKDLDDIPHLLATGPALALAAHSIHPGDSQRTAVLGRSPRIAALPPKPSLPPVSNLGLATSSQLATAAPRRPARGRESALDGLSNVS